jgi:hypothetical protein
VRTYGRVPTIVWLQKYPSEDVRTLRLYAMSGPHSNGVGCYRLPVSYIGEDLSWNIERASEALRQALAVGLIDYDYEALWMRIPGHFETSPIESPNGAKNLMPFIEAVPKESSVFFPFIRELAAFSSKFPRGFLEGLRSPCLSPHEAEQAASSCSKEDLLLNLPSEQDTARGEPVNKTELDLNDFTVASVVVAKMLMRHRLTQTDQQVLLGWVKNYEMGSQVLPWLEMRIKNYTEQNGQLPAHPLKYFSAGLTEHLAKSRIK